MFCYFFRKKHIPRFIVRTIWIVLHLIPTILLIDQISDISNDESAPRVRFVGQ